MEYNTNSDLERRILELILFNNLILNDSINEFNEYSEYPESFWDPVIVSLNEDIINSGIIELSEECTICTNNNIYFKTLPCCNNVLCVECNINWFNISVYCPYCKHDLRNQT
jgi:hypothetical protein